MPLWGLNQERKRDQKPSMVLTWISHLPSFRQGKLATAVDDEEDWVFTYGYHLLTKTRTNNQENRRYTYTMDAPTRTIDFAYNRMGDLVSISYYNADRTISAVHSYFGSAKNRVLGWGKTTRVLNWGRQTKTTHEQVRFTNSLPSLSDHKR